MPYDVYETADGHVILAVGNDGQFRRFCGFIDHPHLADDPRYATNPARLEHRETLNAVLRPALQSHDTAAVIAGLEACKVPVGPVKTLDQVFATDQVAARQMQIAMQAGPGEVQLIGNPLKLSRTPVTYRNAPPEFGADTQAVLNAENPFDD